MRRRIKSNSGHLKANGSLPVKLTGSLMDKCLIQSSDRRQVKIIKHSFLEVSSGAFNLTNATVDPTPKLKLGGGRY